jgi:pre-mRNA-splicing factor SYF1
MRAGLTQFSDQAGKLWTALADHFIRMGHFERVHFLFFFFQPTNQARDIFEEGMNKVITVKDFTIIWDAYAEFEDGLLNAQAASLTGLK